MSKYHSKRITIDGHDFPSHKEGTRYMQLKLLQKAGIIRGLQIQVPFVLFEKSEYGRQMKYIADFVYYEGDQMIVEDVKGYKTKEYKIKRRLMGEIHNIKIKET